MSAEREVPTDVSTLEEDTVLYDRHREEYFVVTTVEEAGIGLRREEVEYYLPHTLFAPWNDQRLVSIEKVSDADPPDWAR